VTLLRAHRILIGTAIVFFAFYGAWEYAAPHGRGSPWRALASVAAAALLAVYFRSIGRETGPPGAPDGGGR
jgi:hypothetical protein